MNELSSNPLLFASIIVAISIAGGLWRRQFGGWLGLSRVMLLSLSIIAASAMAYFHYGLDWRVVIIAMCWAWMWSDGHQFALPARLYSIVMPRLWQSAARSSAIPGLFRSDPASSGHTGLRLNMPLSGDAAALLTAHMPMLNLELGRGRS